MKLILENWRKFANETKNKAGKEQGVDGKACWDGYKYAGTEDGKDKCVPMEEEQGLDTIIDEEIEAVLAEKAKKPCKPSKGKRFAKRVDGKCRSFGQSGQAKSGGDRIRPGTKKGDAYCARSAKIKKWKCRGSKSTKE